MIPPVLRRIVESPISTVARHNEIFRLSMGRNPAVLGRIRASLGVSDFGPDFVLAVLRGVRDFHEFTPENDPWMNRDFGDVTVGQTKVFWKIDLYDENYRYGTDDPENLAVTRRELNLFLAEEY